MFNVCYVTLLGAKKAQAFKVFVLFVTIVEHRFFEILSNNVTNPSANEHPLSVPVAVVRIALSMHSHFLETVKLKIMQYCLMFIYK